MGQYPNFALLDKIIQRYSNEVMLLDFLKKQGKLSPKALEYIGKAIRLMTLLDKRFRDSGEQYIRHYIGSTAIAAVHCGIYDPEILIAIIFHDCKEDFPWLWPSIVNAEIRAKRFTPRIVTLVEGVSKPNKLLYARAEGISPEKMLTKYFSRISNSTELAFVKLPEAMYNLLTLDGCTEEKQRRKIGEIEQFLSPLAIKYSQLRLAEGYREGIQKTKDRLALIATP